MAAPTEPSIAALAGTSESEVLAHLLYQSRRNETQAGGTPATNPTFDEARAMGSIAVLAYIVASQRNLENLL